MLEALRPYIHPDDLEADYVQAPNNYEHYFEYSALKKPRAILEIGVRRGYSIIAMCLGHMPQYIQLIDSGVDGFFPEVVAATIIGIEGNHRMVGVYLGRSQEIPYLKHGFYDLIHIDGEHTPDALRSDLQYLRFLAPDGWIIVDDVKDMPELMDVCREFAEQENLECVYNPTFRGHAILRRKANG